jgi:transcriptional regulator with XRE-family HTH domain
MSATNLDFILNNIRKQREKDFLSQEYMAHKLGISQNTYSKIELGKNKLTVDRLIGIAEILGVEVAELLK